MTNNAPVAKRPFSVSIISILLLIGGVLLLLSGILLIANHGNQEAQDSLTTASPDVPHGTTLLIIGIYSLVAGLLYLLASRGLWRGSGVWRAIVIAVSVVNIIALILSAIFVNSTSSRLSAVVTILVAILVIAALTSAKARAFFAR